MNRVGEKNDDVKSCVNVAVCNFSLMHRMKQKEKTE